MSEQTHSLWNQHFMRRIIDSVADGIFIVDSRGLVSFWNPSMEKISGYSAQEAVGRPCTLISCTTCTGETCDKGVAGCSLIDGGRSETVECLLRHKSGYDVPVIKKASVVEDESGRFLGVVEALTDLTELKKATQRAEDAAMRLGDIHNINQIVGKSHAIQRVFTALKAAAPSDATILVQGESGTGKELVASAIHFSSERREGPFVTVNCAALSESLLESELFGHIKGAYTGAIRDRIGRFEEAEGGTIFLDEIGELSPLIQVKLLRVLQEREIERVGDSAKRSVNIRIITATHRDLLSMVVEGRFREDLYYRLKVFPINLPPLRNRKDDIPLLVSRFIEKMNGKTGKNIRDISQTAMKSLLDYHWPGNVRELENCIEYTFVLCNSGSIELSHLPGELQMVGSYHQSDSQTAQNTLLQGSNPRFQQGGTRLPHQPYQTIIEPAQNHWRRFTDKIDRMATQQIPSPITEPQPVATGRRQKVTREELLALLEACNWNKKEAGRRIGVSHTAIWKYMKKWNIPLKKV